MQNSLNDSYTVMGSDLTVRRRLDAERLVLDFSGEQRLYIIVAGLSTVALEDQFGLKGIDIILDICEVTPAGPQVGRD